MVMGEPWVTSLKKGSKKEITAEIRFLYANGSSTKTHDKIVSYC